jgi:hypothetical protein
MGGMDEGVIWSCQSKMTSPDFALRRPQFWPAAIVLAEKHEGGVTKKHAEYDRHYPTISDNAALVHLL